MRADPAISVCIPLYNEEGQISELLDRVMAVLQGLPGGPHEVILVDDGSKDQTANRVQTYQQKYPEIRLVRFSRNFGQQQAYSAALEQMKGDVAFLMDGDLQDPPEVLPEFVHHYKEGCEVVYAVRKDRKENAFIRWAYHTHYKLMHFLAEIPIPLDTGDFSLISRRVVDLMNSALETNRYLRGLRAWAGFRQKGIPVERDPRLSGETKYTYARLIKLALDGLLSFSVVPLRMASLVGAAIVFLSALFGLYTLYAKFFMDKSPTGFTALMLSIILLGGVQLIFMGVIGEYIGRIYQEVKRRPHYIISDIIESGKK